MFKFKFITEAKDFCVFFDGQYKYYEIYWDYGWNLKSCGLFSSEVRQYKTWKHNRRTQYKL